MTYRCDEMVSVSEYNYICHDYAIIIPRTGEVKAILCTYKNDMCKGCGGK